MFRAGTGLLCALLLASCSSAPTRPPLFSGFLRSVEGAPDSAARAGAAAGFWKALADRGTPLLEEDSVVFVHRAQADSVRLAGDITGWQTPLPLRRIAETDLWYLRLALPQDGRFDYLILVDTAAGVLDPGNPRSVPSGFGPKSELAMPGFRQAPEVMAQPEGTQGTLTTLVHRSDALGYEHTLHVYLPPGYEASADRYPVAYFQDGNDYLFFAGAARILDNLIDGGSIRPVMAVFVVPPVLPERNRRTEYAMNPAYAKFFADELVPFIDARYRTLARAPHRLVIGPSYGGLISLFIAARRPDVFGLAASQSGYVGFGRDSLHALFPGEPPLPLRLSLDVGLYETVVGLPRSGEENFLEANRRFRDVLLARGYAPVYREFADGHSWGRWRNEIPFIFRLFFSWTP